jgi:hypothetical protein
VKSGVWLVSYNGLGGHPALSFAGDVLLGPSVPHFGDAVVELDIYPHLPSGEPPPPSLADMSDRFRERLATLPRVWFRRKKRLIEVAYRSRLGTAEALAGRAGGAADVSLLRDACAEITATLDLIRDAVKPRDDFDAEGLLRFVRGRQSELERASDRAVLEVLVALRESERRRVAALRDE